MPVGIEDTWVDGLEAYVLVEGQAEAITRCFGDPKTWWPRPEGTEPDRFWQCRQAGLQEDSPQKEIAAYVAHENDMTWCLVQAGASNGDAWAEDDDYHIPMFQDACAALKLAVHEGPELYEAPVRVAARLSRELNTKALAIWGSDEEPGLEGICLFENGEFLWAASTFSRDEMDVFLQAYIGESGLPEALEEERHGFFYLYRPGQPEERVEQPINEWADGQARAIGAGLDLSISPHNLYPDDFPQCAQWMDQFMVALKK